MSQRTRRKKASEIYRENDFPFAPKTVFAEAFPTVENVWVEVVEEGTGSLGTGRRTRTRTYNKGTLSEYVDCGNHLCFNGGFSVGDFLRDAVGERRKEFQGTAECQGYEGSPNGHRRYKDCFNTFTVRGTITYVVPDPERGFPP